MEEGLLWYDDSPDRSLAQKVALAAARHYRKYGVVPNVCYVNASALGGGGCDVPGIEVEPLKTVLRYHFWIGREERQVEKLLQGETDGQV